MNRGHVGDTQQQGQVPMILISRLERIYVQGFEIFDLHIYIEKEPNIHAKYPFSNLIPT
jgi:hypothetical protein